MALINKWMDGQTDGRMDGWMDGWTDRWTDGWMDGEMDGRMEKEDDIPKKYFLGMLVILACNYSRP